MSRYNSVVLNAARSMLLITSQVVNKIKRSARIQTNGEKSAMTSGFGITTPISVPMICPFLIYGVLDPTFATSCVTMQKVFSCRQMATG